MNRPRQTLYTYIEGQATPEQRETFLDAWPFYLRNVLGIARDSRHVWPYSPQYAIKCGLSRVGRRLVAEKKLDSMSFDAFVQWFDANSPGDDLIDTRDIPSSLSETFEHGNLADPLSFPDDSQIYKSWKAISAAIETIDQGISNVELQTRRVLRQNNTIARDIERLGKIIFVQDQFVSKFSLGTNDQQSELAPTSVGDVRENE